MDEQGIARACSSLLRKSADGLYFEFAHFSVREFLEDSSLLERLGLRSYHISESSISDAVACQCLRFLQLENFDRKLCQDPGHKCGICTKGDNLYEFYRFATIAWPLLSHAVQEDNLQPSTELLELQKSIMHPRKSNTYLHWAVHFSYCFHNDGDVEKAANIMLHSGLSTLHVAAALDLVAVGTWLLGLDIPTTSQAQIGSVFEYSIGGVAALFGTFDNSNAMAQYCPTYPRSSALAEELSLRGETLSAPSDAFTDRRLMQLACRLFFLEDETLPLKLLLSNGWRLNSEDISIARDWQAGLHFDGEKEGLLLDFVKHLDALGVHKTREGHELCTLIWTMAVQIGKIFTDDTSLLPSEITLSDKALVNTTIKYIQRDDFEALKACEHDARFDLHKIVDHGGKYAIHIAADSASWHTLNYIIDAGCEIGKRDSLGRNFLHALMSSKNGLFPKDDGDFPTIHTEIAKKLIPELQNLMDAEDDLGQTALELAFRLENCGGAIWLLKHYDKQLGCCHGRSCIWDQAALAHGSDIIRTLVDIEFPRHPQCSDSRVFHSLNAYTNLETFELLHALYPGSLKKCIDGKTALESCLQIWTEKVYLQPARMDVEVIRAFLRYSKPLSPTSSEATKFCCFLLSHSQPSGPRSALQDSPELLQTILESGLDVHHEIDGKYILETACESFKTGMFKKSEFAVSIMKVILDRVDNKKINRPNAAGSTILHTICTATSVDTEWLLPELVKRGADVNVFCRDSQLRTTPLITALERPSPQSMKSAQILLTLGADPALSASTGWDAAHMASLRGAEPFLQNLLLHITRTSTLFDWKRRCTLLEQWNGSDRVFRGLNSLHLASMTGQKDCFDFFVDNSLIENTHDTSEDGFSCLHFAAFDASARMIDYLVDQGLDIDQVAADGSTPLHVAVQKKNRLGVQRLLSGNPLIRKDIFGMTPMMYARKSDLHEIIELLARYDDADTDVRESNVLAQGARNRYWRKALETAIMQADVQLCTRIMDEGCPVDISLPGCGGCSPLLMSIGISSASHLGLVRLFLEKSASAYKQSCSRHGSRAIITEAIRRPYLNCFLSRMLDLCLQGGSANGSRKMLLECLKCGNSEALPIIIKHVSENEADYA